MSLCLLLRLFFTPFSFLERRASEYGRLTFQNVELADGLGWHCSLRASGAHGKPRYAWTASSRSLKFALYFVIKEARENPIEAIVGTRCVPKLGDREYDD